MKWMAKLLTNQSSNASLAPPSLKEMHMHITRVSVTDLPGLVEML